MVSTREKRRRAVGVLLAAMILILCATPQFRALVTFPDHVRLTEGTVQEFDLGLPARASVEPVRSGTLAINGRQLGDEGTQVSLGGPVNIAALQTGQFSVDFRLFGLIPFRKMKIDVVPQVKLVPGGHSIGVLLRSQGLMVVGYAAVRDAAGRIHQPAREAGLEPGDAIVKIDGVEVTGEYKAAQLFEEAGRSGRPVTVTVKRRSRLFTRALQPVQDGVSGRWRVGLYIRDGAAGIGTLTFYHPGTGRYGALGHVIADSQSGDPIEVRDGHIVEAEVVSIQKGRRQAPGEKMSTFKNADTWLGSIEKNTRFGIFGSMHTALKNPLYPNPLPVAMASEVKEGPAEILTVVAGQRLERYTVEIQRVMRESTAEGKNMILKVTDPRLLERTGGIVQGMSGSPIIQNGRIVGAVTHVFVSDPTRGYGVLIEWMLQDAGVIGQRTGMSFGGENPPGLIAAISSGGQGADRW